jgi:hypothetical protein
MIRSGGKCWLLVVGCLGFASRALFAQAPTYSLEVAAINGMPVTPRLSSIEVEQGDVITVEVFLRNWSVSGVPLKAYQFAFDSSGYTSGFSGNVHPRDFATTTQMPVPCTSTDTAGPENTANAFIDTSRPDFVHAALNPYFAVGTRRCGYRYGSAVPTAGPTSLAGVKKYCGTLILMASADATGTFTVRLDRNTDSRSFLRSGFAGGEPTPIEPLSFEDLTILVVPEIDLNIMTSDPPDESIDARYHTSLDGATPLGTDSVALNFNKPPIGLMPGDFLLAADPAGHSVTILEVMTNANTATLSLDEQLPAGKWMMITHNDFTPTNTRIGILPGDVSNDGECTVDDVETLVLALNNGVVLTERQRDIDRSLAFNPQDLIAEMNLLIGAGAFDAWLGESLPDS